MLVLLLLLGINLFLQILGVIIREILRFYGVDKVKLQYVFKHFFSLSELALRRWNKDKQPMYPTFNTMEKEKIYTNTKECPGVPFQNSHIVTQEREHLNLVQTLRLIQKILLDLKKGKKKRKQRDILQVLHLYILNSEIGEKMSPLLDFPIEKVKHKLVIKL